MRSYGTMSRGQPMVMFLEIVDGRKSISQMTIIYPGTTVAEVKARALQRPTIEDRLVLHGRVLPDPLLIQSCRNLKRNDTLFLILGSQPNVVNLTPDPELETIPRCLMPEVDISMSQETPKGQLSLMRRINNKPMSHFFARVKAHDIPGLTFSPKEKRNFVAKVYSILSLQLLLTAGWIATCLFVASVQSFMVSNSTAITFGLMVPTFLCTASMFWLKNRYPFNYAVLALFTVLEALSIGCVSAIYAKANQQLVVMEAFGIAAVVFVALTLFARLSGIDFSFLRYFLVGGSIALIVGVLIIAILGFNIPFLVCLFGVVLFSLFVLYDTDRILNTFGPEDVVLAAMELMLDFINLFYWLLLLLSGGGPNQD